jgi:hypothetical protein
VRSEVAEVHVGAGGLVQLIGVPAHTPDVQLSLVVQALPSSHLAALA